MGKYVHLYGDNMLKHMGKALKEQLTSEDLLSVMEEMNSSSSLLAQNQVTTLHRNYSRL